MPSCEWSGESYDRVSGPQQAFGAAVLERLELTGSERVLDAGCGSGRVTELLLRRLPRGHVVAVDVSESMVAVARRRLGSRVRIELADLLELDLGETFDAVLSTATFHWIGDHARLFERLRGALRPGGALVAQCGGAGNISGLRGRAREVSERRPYAEHFCDWRDPWNYAGAEETRAVLLGAGFGEARCWLEPAPVVPEHPREFLRTVILAPHIQHLPEPLREPFLEDVIQHVGTPVEVDYVRLNIDAVA
jgi:trans-aconitate 2-methyltransferase